MKKILFLILSLLCVAALFTACSSEGEEELVLRVYNWQEYIDDGLEDDVPSVLDAWAEDYYQRTGKRVTVLYDTFETNESMLNTLKTGKTQYDLACPSDYVIQKMIAATENSTDADDNIAIEPFDYSKLPNYTDYASPFIKDVFDKNGFSEYSVGYMWGTVGIIYNPEYVDAQDVNSWSVYWNDKYKNKMTVKDSVRDALIPAISYVYSEEIYALKSRYEAGNLTLPEYQAAIDDILNRTDDETLEAVGKVMAEMKSNIYGLEVDSGKSDIVSGKIVINQAWSGDAVYSMDTAEEVGVELAFTVPEDGGSVWFDGWVMPKGANTELAQDFVNYLCRPDVAARNMNYIGYTSVIAGNEIFDLVCDWYGSDEGEHTVDLTYFFEGTVDDSYLVDGKLLVRTDELGRQFSAQYPEKEIVDRCSVMRDFGERNVAVLNMWLEFKAETFSLPLILLTVAVIVLIGAVLLWFTKPKRDSARRRKEWLASRR